MSKKFSENYQPENRRGRGKSFKTKLFDAMREQALADCGEDDSPAEVETKFLAHVATRAFSDTDPSSATLLKELVAKSYASIKPTLEKVDFDFDASKPAHEQSSQILQAAADGVIPPDVATIFIQAIKSNIDIEESTELKERIEKLEALLGAQSS